MLQQRFFLIDSILYILDTKLFFVAVKIKIDTFFTNSSFLFFSFFFPFFFFFFGGITHFFIFTFSLLIFSRVEQPLLFMAAQKGHQEVIQVLLNQGANVNVPNQVFIHKYLPSYCCDVFGFFFFEPPLFLFTFFFSLFQEWRNPYFCCCTEGTSKK